MLYLFERLEIFAKDTKGRLYQFNCLKQMGENKYFVVNLNPISSSSDKNFFLEREGYLFDMLSLGNFNEAVFFDSPYDAIRAFLEKTGFWDNFSMNE
jgi:hypothetical protein